MSRNRVIALPCAAGTVDGLHHDRHDVVSVPVLTRHHSGPHLDAMALNQLRALQGELSPCQITWD